MNKYDIIIIGGGINGVGIAQDASLRGFRTLLLEQDDICSGVSAWSGRLAHGGLRYLEHYDFALVRESLAERERLFHNAPHLAKPISWLMPVFSHNKRPGWLVELGMFLFDLLSFDKTSPSHRPMSRKKVMSRFPSIMKDGLKAGFLYYDGQIELVERLCIEVALDARANGAEIKTHSRVEEPVIVQGRVAGVKYRSSESNELEEALAPVIFNVAGPWIDRVFKEAANIPAQPRLNGGTKGSHLIVNRFPGAPKDVIYYESKSDGRLILIVPWLDKYLIGTTDIRWEADPTTARCDIGELEYLLEGVNALIPTANLTREDVLYTYSGVRPLPYEPNKAESSVTRTHIVYDHKKDGLPGLFTVVGGKLTTFRQLAEDAVDIAAKQLGVRVSKSSTRLRLLPGAHFSIDTSLVTDLVVLGAPRKTAERLAKIYGSRSKNIWELVEMDKSFGEIVDDKTGLTKAEIIFVIDTEFPRTLTDIMARRIVMAFEPGHGLAVLEKIANIAASKLGWSKIQIREEITGYHEWLDYLAIPSVDGLRSTSFGAGAVTGVK